MLRHVLFLDGDVLAVDGPIRGVADAPLKRAFSAALADLRAFENNTETRAGTSTQAVGALVGGTAGVSASASESGKGAQLSALASAIAAVPEACTPEAFANDFVHRQFPEAQVNERLAAKAWLREWAAWRSISAPSSLCFNAGVMLISTRQWRRLALPERLARLAMMREPHAANISHLTFDGQRAPLPVHALWSEGTQRPMRLAFAGEYVTLPAELNARGCGASRIPNAIEIASSSEARAADATLRRLEHGRFGGLLHFTGGYKPWDLFGSSGRLSTTSSMGVRPCLFAARLYPSYILLAERLLAGDTQLLEVNLKRASEQRTPPTGATGTAGETGTNGWERAEATAGHSSYALLRSCVALEYLCDSGVRVSRGMEPSTCVAASCVGSAANSSRCAVAALRAQQGRRCCLTTDLDCKLPCEITSATVCSNGTRVGVGVSFGLPAAGAGAVCLPRTCTQPLVHAWGVVLSRGGNGTSNAISSASGTSVVGAAVPAGTCSAAAVARTGLQCCGATDVGCVIPSCAPRKELCIGGIRALYGTVCLPTSCGTAEEYRCKHRGGGYRVCCAAAVRSFGKQCCYPTDTGCMISSPPEARHNENICDGPLNRPLPNRTVSDLSKRSSADVCCAASCGAMCTDDAVCAARPGGRTKCCPETIRRSGERCNGIHRRSACAFTNWTDYMMTAHVAWGLYASMCAAVDSFASACIGCFDAHTHGIAVVDRLRPQSGAVLHAHVGLRCQGAHYTFLASRVLQQPRPGVPIPASDLRNWPKTQGLVGLLLDVVPQAEYYLKIDTDTFLSMSRLRLSLLDGVGWDLATPPDYLGKPMNIFTYKGTKLTYMQGGACISMSPRTDRLGIPVA